jgi:hypothetical protein
MQLTAGHLHLGLYHYWDRVRGDRPMPARADLRPEELRSLLPHLTLVETDGDGYRYRLVGTAVAEALGRDLTGTRVGSHVKPAAYASEICRVYDLVLHGRRPIFTTGEYQNESKVVHSVCRLLLPLSADGAQVNMIVVSRASRISDQPLRPVDWMETRGQMHGVTEIAVADDVTAACAHWESSLGKTWPAVGQLRA